ncbi:hypothetical protein WICPIJ_009837 [Wickerhamomyces pijperi]|uniref:Uncharacterized protein n=1 Tax=Wickerhamomyces pijperi TaxID=599730 RepID=A0A9P8TCF2_WICPI|nr:hypothetical protein WICPIJ_009837 [Wickerhamomyces pijperi]
MDFTANVLRAPKTVFLKLKSASSMVILLASILEISKISSIIVSKELASCDLGEGSDLGSQIGSHQVDIGDNFLPQTINVTDLSLNTQLTFNTDILSNSGNFTDEQLQRVHHLVDCQFQIKNLTLSLDMNLLGEVTISNSLGDVGDRSNLVGQVGGHSVNIVGQILPCAINTIHHSLTAQNTIDTDVCGQRRDLNSKSL